MRILDVIAGMSFLAAVVVLPFAIWKWGTYLTRRQVSHPSRLRSDNTARGTVYAARPA